jgi:hypothetical protein
MTNLVDTFFTRNLTEAEAEALDQLLEKSPGEALRMGERMRVEYLALGLPEPVMPRRFYPPHPGLSLGKLFLLAAVCSTGILTWVFWPKPVLKMTEPALPAIKAVAPLAVAKPQAKLPPPPLQIPQRLMGTSDEGNRLSVVVELDKPAPVEVNILNTQDQVVRALYQGVLPSGKWSIRWDGLLSDGTRAPAGEYHIQVQSGTTQMSKAVSIEKDRLTSPAP